MAGPLRALAAVLALLFASVGGGITVAGPAAAVDTSRGRAGFCLDAGGVTVVVDFQELGGQTIVRCAVGAQATGLAALKAAGIEVTGTNRWGESFVCRLEGKPGPDREPCVDTPPTSAYWSYWHAPDGGSWTYSQQGATYRTPPAGSFEGWSFSLDHDEDSAPAPRVAPQRPAATQPPGGSDSGGTDPGGGSGSGGSHGGSSAGGGAVGGSSGGGVSGSGGPHPGTPTKAGGTKRPEGRRGGEEKSATASPAASAPAPGGSPSPVVTPTEAADWTGGEDRPAAGAKTSGVPTGTVVGAAAAVALLVAGGVAAWRRRRSADEGGSVR